VAGAVVSIFGKGLRGGTLVTLADSQGQFAVPLLPPGSYTLRAVGTGHQPSAAQRVTVLPDRDASFTLSLTPVGDAAATAVTDTLSEGEAAEARREWRWLVRHKRRSVLETAEHSGAADPAASLAPAAPSFADLGALGGSMELAATANGGFASDPDGTLLPGGVGSLRLGGRLADGVEWSLGGLMAENEGRTWRMAAEFVLDPGGGHEIEAGAGYGAGTSPELSESGALPVEPRRNMGSVFVKDRWKLHDRVTATGGARYTYVGFLPDSHHADAVVEIELRGDRTTLVRGSVATRTLAPGGDILTLSTVAASPAITWARLEEGLQPARSLRYEVGVDRTLGRAGSIGAMVFDEATQDVLLTTFEGHTPVVRNAGRFDARGFGVTVGGRLGRVVNGSVTYTFGQGRRGADSPAGAATALAFEQAEFHDVVARLETVIDWTDTRLAALYRLNALSDERGAGFPGTPGAPTVTAARFDVQLRQGLPFLQPLTRADWEVLVAVRNMFYEASQAGFLDELAVQDPPTRVVGGISVRF
jgi:hypothetical protein